MAAGTPPPAQGYTQQGLYDAIDDIIKVAPLGVTLDPNKLEGRRHAGLLKGLVAYTAQVSVSAPSSPDGVVWGTPPGTPTITASTVTETSSTINNNGSGVTIPSSTLTFTAAATGKKRKDAIVAVYLGTPAYAKVTGVEVDQYAIAPTPSLSPSTMFVRWVDVTETAVTAPAVNAVKSISYGGAAAELPDVNGKIDIKNILNISATASGTNTYTATISPSITALTAGQHWLITFTNANTGTGTPTLNLNSKGAKNLVKPGGAAWAAGDIPSLGTLHIYYDGTSYQVIGGLVDTGSTIDDGSIALTKLDTATQNKVTAANFYERTFRCNSDIQTTSSDEGIQGNIVDVTAIYFSDAGTAPSATDFTWNYKTQTSTTWTNTGQTLSSLKSYLMGTTGPSCVSATYNGSVPGGAKVILSLKRYS